MDLTPQHSELVELLGRLIEPCRKLTIGVDGRDGSGKTGLARYLAWRLDTSLIETDLLIIQGAEAPSYRYDDLTRLVHARHSLDWPVIVEGVFLLDTLQQINVTCDYLIRIECREFDGSELLRQKLNSYESQFNTKGMANYVLTWHLRR